jgi:hypothetical protein
VIAAVVPMPDAYDSADDMNASIDWAYCFIRQRAAATGRGWGGWPAVQVPMIVRWWRSLLALFSFHETGGRVG